MPTAHPSNFLSIHPSGSWWRWMKVPAMLTVAERRSEGKTNAEEIFNLSLAGHL